MAAVSDSRFLPFLDAGEEERLLANAPVQSFAREEMIFDEDISMRAIFFIEAGSVRVERRDRGAMVPLATLGVGEFFGEMSFVDGAPTSARVVAEEPARLRIVDAAAVSRLSSGDPGFAARFYQSIAAILSQRLRLRSMRIHLDQSWG